MSEADDYLMKNWTDEYLDEKLELTRVWQTLDNGFEIQELKSDRVDEVIKMVKEYYIIEETSMVGCQMQRDLKSVEQYLYLSRNWMMDTLSTVAVEQGTGNIIGFIVCRFNELLNKDREFSRENVYEGDIWIEIQKFKQYLTKRGNPYAHYHVDKVLEVYSWFVLPKYRRKGIGSELLKNVIERQLPEYSWFEIDVIVGVFTGKMSQRIAESLGMETLYDFLYAGWTLSKKDDSNDTKMFFERMIPDNHSAKVMSMQIQRHEIQQS